MPIVPAIPYNINGGDTAALSAKPGLLVAVMCTAAAGAAARVDVFDNATAASGTLLCKLQAAAGTTTVWTPAIPIRAYNGLFAGVNGSGALGIVVIA
jgi:hypothetical protein